MTVVDDETPQANAPPDRQPSLLMLRSALAVSSFLAVISMAAAAYYIPHLRVYPVCLDIVKDEVFVFKADMSLYFVERYVNKMVIHGDSVRYDREKRIILIAPADYSINSLGSYTLFTVVDLLKEQGDAPSDRQQRNRDSLWKGKPAWLWPDCDLVKRVASGK